MTLTTLHLGQAPGRVRHAVARPGSSFAGAWRTAVPAFGDLRATRLAPMSSGNGYEGIAAPAGDMGVFCTTPTTKRNARHLDPRST